MIDKFYVFSKFYQFVLNNKITDKIIKPIEWFNEIIGYFFVLQANCLNLVDLSYMYVNYFTIFKLN